ncbi:MAG: amino acid ABC transporter ATP-binding protein [Oscillospiraceae bacterium]|jgi:polar amino acid transport system ATP-binding protein|nr:amino acid ABC transporter ATP-binding protein [Oscillospiraceae bacterium]
MLKATNVTKSFGKLKVLKGVSAAVSRGEVVAIIGSSGSGKSTFLRCLNYLEKVDGGSVTIDGESLVSTDAQGKACYAQKEQLRRICLKMGMVFQNYHLFPHMNVLRNITEAQVHVLGRSKTQAAEYGAELLTKVGLSDKAQQYPYQLSGGQCQRVAIARALALDPELLCFDEPTSALDPQITQEVLAVIRQLAGEHRTMIVVTHEMRFALEVADRVIFMEDGVIAEEGTSQEMLGSGRSERIRRFMGE